jgi:hypothetical protein
MIAFPRFGQQPGLAVEPAPKPQHREIANLVEKLMNSWWLDQGDQLIVLRNEAEYMTAEIESNLTALIEFVLECGGPRR